MVAASSASNDNKAATNTIFGPERLVLLHSPDPIDLGLRLEYSPTDGRVRIVYIEEDDNNNDHVINNGVVEGAVHNGDIVVEAAGVNMRKPISDHMWKLTEGLMKVAPRPIEIIVATMKETTEDDIGAGTTANVVASEMDPDGMASVYGASVYGTYYQLEMGENARTTDAMLHHLPGECSTDEEEDDGDEQLHPEVVHNPFEDVDRFGTERRIIFHTQALGVKLHRSASEGIVHILTVTPYKPFGGGDDDNDMEMETPVREGPDNGYLEAGDTIFEVGGVDLRGKVIGKLEWADMVHFIKHVHRPLDMVVAKDKLFTLERAGVTKDVADDLSNAEVEEVNGRVVGDVEDKEDNGEHRDDPETNNENHGYSHMLDNTCFNIAVDDICNLPCGGGKSSTIPSSPTRADNSWIKPETKVHPWNKKADDNDDDMESVIAVSVANKTYEPSITDIIDEEEQNVVSPNNDNDAKAESRPTTMQLFSRTGPNGNPNPVHPSSPVVPVSPVTTTAAAVAPSAIHVAESEGAEKKLTVSQLREMFSPIQSIAPGGNTSIANTNDDVIGSPILKPNARATSEQEQANRAQLNGLFSPIVTEDTTPTPPNEDSADVIEEILKFDAIRNAPAPDSPGDWSTKSPLSDKCIGSPIAESGVADVIMSEARNDITMEDTTQSMMHDVKDVSPPAMNSNIDMEQATESNKDERPSNVAKEVSSPDDNCGDAAESMMQDESLVKDISPPPMHTNTGKKEVAPVPIIAQAPSSDAKSEPRPHMPFYARTHPKGKSSVVQQTSPVRASPIARTTVPPENRIQAPSPEPSSPHPNDETNDSSFHSTVLHDLKDEFHSRDKALHSPECRDDRAEEAPSKTKHGVESLTRNQLRPEWVVHQHQERHDLSPTGSTVSVEDKTTSAKKSSADATFFSERFFHTMDAADSPFVGNIKFATPNQRVPASALFSEAFLVQKPGTPGTTSNIVNNDQINVRWVQTDSPLFVTKKQIDEHVDDGVVKKDNVGTLPSSSYHETRPSSRTQPPSNTDDDLLPNPDVKRFNNLTAFDMTNLEGGLSLIDCDPESESPSFELNDTIVYADSTEEAQKQCCTMSNLCGSDTMFEGLVQNCIDIDSHRQMKERVNKIPSPRRKNLLERIRNKKKKNKLDNMKNEYGNLGDDCEENIEDSNGRQKEEKMKRIRRAKVQLTFQNMRGQTMASANQFALLMDDEISF